jgi:hypothetical protein
MMNGKPIQLKLFVAEWESNIREEQFMVCLASNRDEAMTKFKAKWDSMYKRYGSKFVTEIEIEPHETVANYVTEHGIDDVVETSHEG